MVKNRIVTVKKIVLFSIVVMTLGACSTAPPPKPDTWHTIEQSNHVAWADDNSEVAVTVLHYEQAMLGDTDAEDENSKALPQRNFSHQIFLQDLAGKQRRPLSKIRPYQNGVLYYMRQAGYLIAEAFDPQTAMQRFDKLSVDGREWLIVENNLAANRPCKDQDIKTAPQILHQVIPSPDGSQLLHVYSPRCGEASIEFLDAYDLNLRGAQQLLIDEPLLALWHPSGYAMLVNTTLTKAWQVTPDLSPQSITPPACLYPVTSSSNVSSDGRLAFFLDDGTLGLQQVAAQQQFGCQ